MTNFERALHVPLIIRAPWLRGPGAGAGAGAGAGGCVRSDAFAELVDLYPTAAELAGLPPPPSRGEMVNGTSLAPWLAAAEGGPARQGPGRLGAAAQRGPKDAAFAQFAKTCQGYRETCDLYNDTFVGDQFVRTKAVLMGYTIRTAAWRSVCDRQGMPVWLTG